MDIHGEQLRIALGVANDANLDSSLVIEDDEGDINTQSEPMFMDDGSFQCGQIPSESPDNNSQNLDEWAEHIGQSALEISDALLRQGLDEENNQSMDYSVSSHQVPINALLSSATLELLSQDNRDTVLKLNTLPKDQWCSEVIKQCKYNSQALLDLRLSLFEAAKLCDLCPIG